MNQQLPNEFAGFGDDGFNADDNANNHDNVVPKGHYVGMIVKAELKPTQSGGVQLKIDFQITEGELKNRHIFLRMTMKSSSEDAQRIGRGQLSTLCKAYGIPNLRNTHELLHHRTKVSVGVRAPKEGSDFGPENTISKWEKLTQAAGEAPAAAPAESAASAPPATGDAPKPW